MMIRSRLSALLLALMLAAMMALIGCSGDSSSIVYQNVSERVSWGVNGKIAFASFGANGLLYIYTINDNGGGLSLLTLSDGDLDLNDEGGRHPAFSPDATRIAMSSRRGESPAIYLIDAVRAAQPPLAAVTSPAGTGADTEPSWTPDGARLVYTSTRRAGDGDIRIINADGTGMAPLVQTDANEGWGVVSPDGKWLAYTSDAAGNTDIWVKDISNFADAAYDPTDPGTNLTGASDFREEAPSWSPDGSKLVFHSNRNGDFDIFMMNADGSGQVAVTADQHSDGFPVFSPNGERLAITRDREIWTIPARRWSDWMANADTEAKQLTRRF